MLLKGAATTESGRSGVGVVCTRGLMTIVDMRLIFSQRHPWDGPSLSLSYVSCVRSSCLFSVQDARCVCVRVYVCLVSVAQAAPAETTGAVFTLFPRLGLVPASVSSSFDLSTSSSPSS